MAEIELLAVFFIFGALFLAWLAFVFGRARICQPLTLERIPRNPVLAPIREHPWESEAVFNPAAFYHDGRVHLFYRALGRDGISRIGYASSPDGIHFDERQPYPAYEPQETALGRGRTLEHNRSYAIYHPGLWVSGGGWGGAEDPRAVTADDKVYLLFTLFQGWNSARVALTSLHLSDFARRDWRWKKTALLSPPDEVHKNWLLFPEKIKGRYAVLHSITPKVAVHYVDDLSEFDNEDVFIQGSGRSGGRATHWDKQVRGAGAPPIKTEEGWLLLYHAVNPEHHNGYNVGVMLLDLEDPTRVRYRSNVPILVPELWYENDWKPGVIYASGAVVLGDDLFVYYGGGDKYVAAARAPLRDFLRKLTSHEHVVLQSVSP